MTILASDNARNRRRAKRASERALASGQQHISRIEKACSSPSLRSKPTNGAACLSEVAIYNAGHRKVAGAVTAR